MTPVATYRLQLHAGFTFDDAAAQAPYLARLGISHVYLSPIAKAREGSTHGYDQVDPTLINPALGGEDGFERLSAAVKAEGLGVLLDIVPNHMAVGAADNAWWLDVLEKGRASAFARYFDIDWDPPDPALKEKVAAPFLGAPYGEALAAGDIRLQGGPDDLSAWAYGHHRFPIRAEHRAEVLARGLGAFDPADPDGRSRLHALLEDQHWRLAWWRTSGDEINWRRFFDITELAGLRIEDDEVFAAVHALPLRLYAEGRIEGLRVDHVDGLADPGGYCRRLRAELDARRPGGWLLLEKILAPDEALDPAWGCDGDTGYAFMAEVGGLLHDPAGEGPLTALWTEASGRSGHFHDEERLARLELLDRAFAGQLAACARAFHRLARAEMATRDLTEAALARAVRNLLAAFPAYRTYAQGEPAGEADLKRLADALAGARPLCAPGEFVIAEQVAAWLAGDRTPDAALAAEAARRFQQLSAPLAAKSVEDTAFYRYGRLLSRNEVGADPGRLALTTDAFHAAQAARANAFPRALLATATHDHKRGEDVRARLAVLSELPRAWAEAVQRWSRREAAGDIDQADALQLYQTLIGAWPDDLDPADQDGLQCFRDRVWSWWRKALREAKLRSSWAAPDEAYEAACERFLAGLMAPQGEGFQADLAAFLARIEPAARANGLVQAFLRCVCPGVPDIYQGCEFRDLSLVDPDNRRPVDFSARAATLEFARSPADMLDQGRYDGAKQAMIARALATRRRFPEAFAGAYVPLQTVGERAGHLLAFRREGGGRSVICAVALRLADGLGDGPLPPPGWWTDTRLDLAGSWRDLLTDAEVQGAQAGDLFRRLPAALLVRP